MSIGIGEEIEAIRVFSIWLKVTLLVDGGAEL